MQFRWYHFLGVTHAIAYSSLPSFSPVQTPFGSKSVNKLPGKASHCLQCTDGEVQLHFSNVESEFAPQAFWSVEMKTEWDVLDCVRVSCAWVEGGFKNWLRGQDTSFKNQNVFYCIKNINKDSATICHKQN